MTMGEGTIIEGEDMCAVLRRTLAKAPRTCCVYRDQGLGEPSVQQGHSDLRGHKEAGVRPSMGTVGDAYDNAMCESFFATLECELLERRRFSSEATKDRYAATVG